MLDAYVFAGIRTPFGRHAGALAALRPDDLAAEVIRHLVASTGVAPERIEDVLLGCAAQTGEDGRNVARHAALLAGLPPAVPGQTVNRLCGSGLAAVLDAARAVTCGEGALFVAGGVESMSRAPYVLGKAETPFGRTQAIYDSTLGPRFPNPRLTERYGAHSMAETGDLVAAELGITREASDRFAAASQAKYQAAKAAGFFDDELLPLDVPSLGKAPPTRVAADEHPRPDTTVEALARLRPLCGGVVTAGNASGINDGAAALLVGSAAAGEAHGLTLWVRIRAGAVVGVEPRVMGLGPALAIPKALARAGLSLDQVDVIELNEAFAPQVLGCLARLGLAFDDSRVNPNGGAIAIGHPLGASGARLALTAARALRQRGGRYAVASLCVGVGQGIALVLERAR